jgi:putative flippase GtrA
MRISRAYISAIKFSRSIFRPEPTHQYSMQFVRSLIVSIIAVVFNIGGYYVLKQLVGINYLIAAPIGYAAGVLVNYYLSVKWVFAERKLDSRRKEFVIFVIINLIGLAFYEILVAGMVEGLNLSALVAPLIATIIIFFWNFLVRKKFLY